MTQVQQLKMSSILKFFKPVNINNTSVLNDVDSDKSFVDSPPAKRQKPENSQSGANLNVSCQLFNIYIIIYLVLNYFFIKPTQHNNVILIIINTDNST